MGAFRPDQDDSRASRPLTKGERRFMFIFMALVFGGFAADLLSELNPASAMVPIFLAAWVVLTALHELGHSAMAWACGWKVARIVVGFGAVWKGWTWRGTRYEIRKIPLGGHMVPAPRTREFWRAKSALIYLAGPATELAIAGLLAVLVGWDAVMSRSELVGIMVVQTIGAAAIWGAFQNLLPLTIAGGGVTDGLGFILSAFQDPEDFTDRRYASLLIECEALMTAAEYELVIDRIGPLADAHPNAIAIQMLWAEAMVRLGHRSEALMQLQALKRRRERATDRIEAVMKRLRVLPTDR